MNETKVALNSIVTATPMSSAHTTQQHQHVFQRLLALDVEQSVITVCFAANKQDELNGATKNRQKKRKPENPTTQAPTAYEQGHVDAAAPLAFEKLLMTDNLTESFRETIQNVLVLYHEKLQKDDLLFYAYNTETQTAEHEIEYLHMSDYASLAEPIKTLSLLADIEAFHDRPAFSNGLRFYVIIVQPMQGESIYFFRTYERKRFLRKGVLAVFDGSVYERVDAPTCLFDDEIDCICYDGMMFVLGGAKTRFQNMFRFYEDIRQIAHETLDTIQQHVPIQGFDAFVTMCQSDPQKLRKLKRIASKPYLQSVTIDDIKKVIAHSKLSIPVVEVNGKEQLVYDEKNKWLILNLLDDNYLESLMTHMHYEVSGKRELS